MIPQRLDKSSRAGRTAILLAVTAGFATLVLYYTWWLTQGRLSSPLMLLGLGGALIYGLVQLGGAWVLYIAAERPRRLAPPELAAAPTVDVFLTACGEEYGLVERALTSACSMRGDFQVWLLDDAGDPALARLAGELGSRYLTREGHEDAKAGNLNAALARTDGDIIVIFDIDHAPEPAFLERTLGYFADPEVGFVQVMLTFESQQQDWVGQAAADSSLDFYNPTSVGADALGSATLVGSNALIRRAALQSIAQYQPGLAEDLATSVALHAAGWQSVYVHEPLAPGIAPPDLPAWFTQQLKWARGVFELLLTAYPRHALRLRRGQRLSYAVRMTYYWIGPVFAVHLLLTLLVLFQGDETVLSSYESYLARLTPLGVMVLLIRQTALRRRSQQGSRPTLQWRAIMLVFATWPIYTLAWLMAVLRVPLGFRPTPKTPVGTLNPVWLLPQFVASMLLIVGLIHAVVVTEGGLFLLVYGFATAQLAAHVLLFAQHLRPQPRAEQPSQVAPLKRYGLQVSRLEAKQQAAPPAHARFEHEAGET